MKTTKRKRQSAAAAAETPAPAKTSASKAADPQAAHAPAIVGSAVVLASHCTVKDAAALQDVLRKAAGERETVTLDVRSLERIDTAAMQLLCAFVRERSDREQKVAWLGDSTVLQDAARLLGVGALLALPSGEPAGAAA